MRATMAGAIANQVHEWGYRGLIDDELQTVLTSRYSIDATMGRVLLRWLGFIALGMLAMSVLGVVSLILGPLLYLAPFALGGLAYGLWRKGIALATDPQQRYATSGAVLVTLGLVTVLGALSLFPFTAVPSMRGTGPLQLVVVAAVALYTAYRFGLRWPLTLGVLLSFHALGSMLGYAGFGSYWVWMGSPIPMSIVAAAAIALGVWHEERKEAEASRLVGFGQIYIVFGLLYTNVALWWLLLIRTTGETVLLAIAVSIGQIIVGGRRHDGRFTGFGIVFLSIHLYTRLFEEFWNEISKGTLFLMAGGIAMAIGAAMELWARRLKGVAA